MSLKTEIVCMCLSLFPAVPPVLPLFSCPSSPLPVSLLLQDLEKQLNPGKTCSPGPEVEAVPQTPDVDLLLECMFSYMHNTDEDERQEQQPMEEQDDEFLSPLIGPEEEEVCLSLFCAKALTMNVILYFIFVCLQEDDLAAPAGLADQMFYSTVSCLDRKSSLSSDEEGDIYCHTLPHAARGDVHTCPSNQTEKMGDQMDQGTQDRDRLKSDQVRHANSPC